MDDFFINDFSLDYLKPAANNREFTLNNETPIFQSCTTAPVNNQENQAQIMENQRPHNTNQFMLQQTMMNNQLLRFHIIKKKKTKVKMKIYHMLNL